jgi:hypothetical protein
MVHGGNSCIQPWRRMIRRDYVGVLPSKAKHVIHARLRRAARPGQPQSPH